MDYLTAVHTATNRLRDAGGADAEACLLLAGHAGQQLGQHAHVWNQLVADLLAVAADLHPDPAPIVLAVDPPEEDTPAVRAGVAELITAVADNYDRESQQPRTPTRQRFAFAAAAIELRRAAGRLT